eukprot:4622822-Lingulodinium_polyedra.AAC.1
MNVNVPENRGQRENRRHGRLQPCVVRVLVHTSGASIVCPGRLSGCPVWLAGRMAGRMPTEENETDGKNTNQRKIQI